MSSYRLLVPGDASHTERSREGWGNRTGAIHLMVDVYPGVVELLNVSTAGCDFQLHHRGAVYYGAEAQGRVDEVSATNATGPPESGR